ncbi:recombinase family protein [Shewanella sp. A3A]|nr:recombinase family protein [Shewanella ferrihydritica]
MTQTLPSELLSLYNDTFEVEATNSMTSKVHSYIRFSSKPQEQGDSIRRQIEATTKWAKLKGLEISELRFQDLGVSGYKNVKREGMEALLSAITSGNIKSGDWIALERLDRFGRQGITETQTQLQKILAQDVNIVCISEGLELDKKSLNDLTKVIQVCIYADIAHKQSIEKSQRVSSAKQAQRAKAKEGKVIKKRLPLWLTRKEDHYVFNEHLETVKRIVELRQLGRGWHGIAKDLNEAGYKPRMTTHWKDNSVVAIVRNPALYGAYQTGKTINGKYVNDPIVIPDYYPAVISYKDWLEIQQEVVNRAGGRTLNNPISGIAKCSCGGGMVLKPSKRTTKTRTIHYRHWVCRNAVDGACKSTHSIRDLDLLIRKATEKLKVKSPAKIMKESDKAKLQIEDMTKRLEEIKYLMTDSSSPFSVSDLSLMAKVAQKNIDIAMSKVIKNEVVNDDFQELKSITDPVQYNIKLKFIVESIVIRRLLSKGGHIRIKQRNGHLINMLVEKKSQRGEYHIKYISSTESRYELGLDNRYEWERDTDDDID